MNKTLRVASYAVICEDEKILLVRVAESNIGTTGMWTLPGGGIDFGEHPEAAVRREVREETGLDFEPTKLARVESRLYDVSDHRVHAIHFFYTGTIGGGLLTSEAGGSTDLCQWVPLSEANSLPLTQVALTGLRLRR